MPYDKGDFTQQGYDGKVSGGLLLNNKRDIDILASTNEEDSTLDLVSVTIEDHLNDLHYAFWGENLEAGEVYEIGAGGGSSVPMLHMTVKNNANENYQLGVETYFNRLIENYISIQQFTISPGIQAEHNFLYVKFEEDMYASFLTYINDNITYTDLNNCSIITNEDAQMLAIIITDTSADSSVTVTIS